MVSNLHRKELKKEFIFLIFWTLSDFIYRTTFSVQDSQYANLMASSSASGFHYFLTFPRMAGFLLFPLSRRIFHSKKSRKALLLGINFLYLFSIPATFFVKGANLILLFLTLSSISLGYVSGGIYYNMAIGLSTSRNRGKIIAIGSSAALLLQFIFQKILNNFYFLTAATVITFAIIVWLVIHPPADWIFENPLSFARETPSWHRSIIQQLFLAVIIILIMQPLCIGNDTYFINANFSGTVDIYGLSRLCMIPGYLIAGFLADRRQGRYYPSLIFVAFLLSIPTVMLPVYPESVAFFLPLYYFYVSFYLYFLSYTFWTLAPKTNQPDFWASTGRVFSDFLEGLSFLILPLIPMQEPIFRVFFYTAILIILFILLKECGFYPDILPDSLEKKRVDEVFSTSTDITQDINMHRHGILSPSPEDLRDYHKHNYGSIPTFPEITENLYGNRNEEISNPQETDSPVSIIPEEEMTQNLSNPSISQDGSQNNGIENELSESQQAAEKMIDFLSQFSFTPREKEIAQALLTTEEPMKALAVRFEISERSIYRYTRSIYSKTDTETRAGLIKLYYEWLNS
ncbi:MAG: hypothetical protein K5989_05605 [Lachnospiraceae bacterium]|nr:hypothetical protein [Lachnospiraceae bacterium]